MILFSLGSVVYGYYTANNHNNLEFSYFIVNLIALTFE